jgi:hypothetical protein
MYRNLFIAWYCLGVLALCLAAFWISLPFIGLDRARGGFGFLGLLGFLPFFRFVLFRREKSDERDISFQQRSLLFGFSNGCMTIFVTNGVFHWFFLFIIKQDSIPLNVFWLPSICGLGVGILAYSVLLLLFYYKGEHADLGGDQ